MKKNNSITKLIAIVGLAIVTLTPSFTNAQSAEVSSDAKKEIEALNQKIEKAISQKALSSIAEMYGDQASILTPGGTKLTGRKAIGDYWYGMANCTALKSEITELGGSGKLIYQVGKWSVTMMKDGKAITYQSDVVLVWKRESNYEYKIQLMSMNNTVAYEQAVPVIPNSANAK